MTRGAALALAALLLVGGDARAQLSLDVNAAIERGVRTLLEAQRPDGSFGQIGDEWAAVAEYPEGTTAFALYTLRKSGVPASHPCFEKGLAWLLERPFVRVYSVATLVLLLDALGDPAHDATIRDAAAWLEERLDEGTHLWAYPDKQPDLSNTQFAALALRAASAHGHVASTRTWTAVIDGVLRRQSSDGGYSYGRDIAPESSGSMTTAGLTTLFIAREALEQAGRNDKERALVDRSVERGWEWLDARWSPSGNALGPAGVVADRWPAFGRGASFHYYMLYGIERVATFFGRRAIGDLPWYRDGALELLGHESPGGGWGSLENTCFALHFLRRATVSGGAPDDRAPPPPESTDATRAHAALDDGGGATWAYTTDEPPRGWNKPGFDDSSWKVGRAGFGSAGMGGLVVRTAWDTPDLWARRTVRWTPADGPLRVFAIHDDGLEVFVDGEPAITAPLFSQGKYVEYELPKAARRALEKGPCVVAVHVHDTGGARSFDLRFRPPPTKEVFGEHWVASLPRDDVPFVRRWLVRGPLDDRAHEALLSREAPEPLAPGRKLAGLAWDARRSLSGDLDLVDALGLDPREVAHAAFVFTTDAPLDGWLWLGASAGLRAFLDGRPLLLHHEHGHLRADALRARLELPAGEHRVVLAVERWDDEARVLARVAARDGTPVPGLRYALPGDEDDLAALVAQPEGRDAAELLARLPPSSPVALRLDREEDRDALAFAGASAGWPRWIGKADKKALGPRPPAGARGVFGLSPSDAGRPSRLLARVALPADAHALVATLAPPVDVGRSAHATLTASDGTTSATAAVDVDEKGSKSKSPWTRLALDVAAFAGRDVLVTLAVAPLPGVEPTPLFVDALSIE